MSRKGGDEGEKATMQDWACDVKTRGISVPAIRILGVPVFILISFQTESMWVLRHPKPSGKALIRHSNG